MSEETCIVCYGNEETLYRLPCKQCNHDKIENVKFIHRECFYKSINLEEEEKTFVDSDTLSQLSCPYCGKEGTLHGIFIKNWYRTVKRIFQYRWKTMINIIFHCLIVPIYISHLNFYNTHNKEFFHSKLLFYAFWWVIGVFISATLGFVINSIENLIEGIFRDIKYSNGTIEFALE